jgi:RES domain-containing protein
LKTLWRISRHCDLEGLGGEKTDGRWHTATRGKRIVYLSEHPALALIEALANLKANPNLLPDEYQLIKIHVADGVSEDTLTSHDLSRKWRQNGSETQGAGNFWLAGNRSALLSVPSAPSPESLNYLFNPLQSDAGGIAIEWCKWIEYDKRLFQVHESFRAKTMRKRSDRK